MIVKRLVLAAGLVGGAILASPPALAQNAAVPPSPAQLRAALLLPEDLDADFSYNEIRNRDLLSSDDAHTKACAKALKGVRPLARSKVATWLARDEAPEGVSEFIVSGTSAQISALERAAGAMVRDCGHVDASTKGVKETITRFPVGKLGDRAYGIRFRSRIVAMGKGPTMALDLLIIRVRNTMIALEHNGFYGQFDPDLTRPAAVTAVTRLREVLKSTAG
ncbi:hypothetical protein IL992_01825 [Microbispora sp. NEAU-D428]|uniref:hypothetical protein n=1 Tax=Microbispora sitophila TaxID=2771537 RepID=UPI0018667EC3|nr:hypothetical protein [Microbispora sitophila]MBE3007933.1 hypothetical protein [Microbispora sitophila]